MDFDLYTLSSIFGITSILLIIPFIIQYIINGTREAVGWWTLGMVATSLGFITNSLRQIPGLEMIAIYANNLLFLFAYIFFYFGTTKFFEKRIKKLNCFILVSIFLICILYFTNIDDNLVIRRIISSITFAFFSIINLAVLIKNKKKSIAFSIVYLAVIFGINAGFFIIRACVYTFNPPMGDIFTTSPIEVAAYIVAISTTILWTFGFILLLNQSLQGQITENMNNLQLIFDTSPDAMLITRMDNGEFVKSNAVFTTLMGYLPEEFIGKTVNDIHLYQNLADRQSLLSELNKKGFCKEKEFLYRKKDGTHIIGAMSAKYISINGVTHIISIIRDITEQKTLQNLLVIQARTDTLTGLTNRRYFFELAENEIKRSIRYKYPISLVLIDIDHFKKINDTYGHIVGDEILQSFGKICLSIIRESDIFARLGGDEFVLLLPETDAHQASDLMQRIHQALTNSHYLLEEEHVKITISAGIACLADNEDINKLMNRSDNALFKAKELGRNQSAIME